MNDLYYQSIHEVSEQIRTKKVSPVELVEVCLARIDALNSKINAFITVLADQARQQAKQAQAEIQAGHYRGPLHGVPIAFKDMYDTAGIKTTAGFQYFKDRVPQKDAVAVQKAKDAGAIIIGKTNMHTLAMGTTSAQSFFGAVHNPWDNDFIAGGSSGGSAAAVATGMCFATVDTDAIGSTRLPASCCGVVGYKCTWGLINNTGVLAGEQADPVVLQLASVGIITRDVADVALVADALGDTEFTKDMQKKSAFKMGVVTNFGATEAIRAIFGTVIDTLKDHGFTATQVEAPFTENPNMQAMEQARKTANEELFKGVDVLVLPTTASEVLRLKDAKDPQALSPQNTFFVNYYGLPAISVPCGLDANGLPIGVQFVGKTGQDDVVLAVAQAFTKTDMWANKRPKI